MNMKNSFRIIGFLEGLSYIALLFMAMPVKYILGNPIYVKILGPIHGGLFVLYIILGFILSDKLNWSRKVLTQCMVSSVLPFGTFIFDKKYLGK